MTDSLFVERVERRLNGFSSTPKYRVRTQSYIGIGVVCGTCGTHIQRVVVMSLSPSPLIEKCVQRSTLSSFPRNSAINLWNAHVPHPFRTFPHPEIDRREIESPRGGVTPPESQEKDSAFGRTQRSCGTALDTLLWPVPVLATPDRPRARLLRAMRAGVRGGQATADPRGRHRALTRRNAAERRYANRSTDAHAVMDGRLFAVPGEGRCTR
jgi:hypothetical protein